MSKEFSIFEQPSWVDITIGDQTVKCAILAETDFDRESRIDPENVYYAGGESRYKPGQSCDFAIAYVYILDSEVTPEFIKLSAECNCEDVPGEGHYDGDEWIWDNGRASEEFLRLALRKAVEETAKEVGAEVYSSCGIS